MCVCVKCKSGGRCVCMREGVVSLWVLLWAVWAQVWNGSVSPHSPSMRVSPLVLGVWWRTEPLGPFWHSLCRSCGNVSGVNDPELECTEATQACPPKERWLRGCTGFGSILSFSFLLPPVHPPRQGLPVYPWLSWNSFCRPG